jgi:hypothetical protein
VTGGRTGDEGAPPTTSPRGLLVGLAAGAPVMAYGVWGAVGEAGRVHPPELARWIVGAAVVHDLVVVPVVLAVAWSARRVVPEPAWRAVRSGLVVSGTLALVAWPFVRGYGRSAGNPSLFPRDYAAGLLAALAVVWAVVAVAVVAAHRRRRPTHAAPEAPAQDTPTRSTTKTSVSSGPMTPPAPREP